MGNKPLGDAPGFKAGTGNLYSEVVRPAVNSGQKIVSAAYKLQQQRKLARENAPKEYKSTSATTAHGDIMRAAVQARQARATNSGTAVNQNLSAVQHAVTPKQASPANAIKEFNQRRVTAAQAPKAAGNNPMHAIRDQANARARARG